MYECVVESVCERETCFFFSVRVLFFGVRVLVLFFFCVRGSKVCLADLCM